MDDRNDPSDRPPVKKKSFLRELIGELFEDALGGFLFVLGAVVVGAVIGAGYGLIRGHGLASLLPAAMGAAAGLALGLFVVFTSSDA